MKKIALPLAGAALLAGAFLVANSWLKQPVDAPGQSPTAVPQAGFTADRSGPESLVETVAPTPLPTPEAPPPPKTLAELLAAATRALPSANPLVREEFYAKVLPEILARDPWAAVQLTKLPGTGPGREELLRRLAQGWARRDPATATAWADSLTDGGERLATLTEAALEIAQTNPAIAVAVAGQYALGGGDHGGTQVAIWENLALLWAARDLPAATAWALQRPEGETRELILGRLAYQQAQTEPVAAAAFVIDRMQPGLPQSEAAVSVLHQWARRDLPAATAWVAAFPAGPLRERAEKELTGLAAYARTVKTAP